MNIQILFGWIAILSAFTAKAPALDWPQWRGPNRDGVSGETGLLQQWPRNGPNRVWLFKETGLGYSGPAVAAGKLFIMGGRDQKEFVIALDAAKGEQLWAADAGPMLENSWGDGPRGTPAVDGERVYALSGPGTLVCVNVQDGKQLWKITMRELGGSEPNWGYTESVLVDGENVYCTPGGSRGAIAALDKKTGVVKWQTKEFTAPAQYSSIIAADHSGTRQLIQLTMKDLVGVAAADGKLLWKSPWPGSTAVIPTPIFHNGHVYITSGYGVGCKLVKIGPGNTVQDVYHNRVMKNHHGGVVLVGGFVYGHSEGGGWICQDFMTGKEVWSERRKLGKGPLTYADGRLYCQEEDSGTIALVETSSRGYREHGRFKLEPQSKQRSRSGRIWTHPVIANGKLYLRDQELLFCYDIARAVKQSHVTAP